MAKLMVIGEAATVEILTDPHDEELLLAKCRKHNGRGKWAEGLCNYGENFDTTDDAWQAAQQHADGVR